MRILVFLILFKRYLLIILACICAVFIIGYLSHDDRADSLTTIEIEQLDYGCTNNDYSLINEINVINAIEQLDYGCLNNDEIAMIVKMIETLEQLDYGCTNCKIAKNMRELPEQLDYGS